MGISTREVRAIATSWAVCNSAPVAEILKAAHWNNRPPLLAFTCVICQGFPSRFIVSAPFQWSKPQLAIDLLFAPSLFSGFVNSLFRSTVGHVLCYDFLFLSCFICSGAHP